MSRRPFLGTPRLPRRSIPQEALVTPLTVANGGTGLTKMPAAWVFKSAVQSIPNNALTLVTFDSEAYDTDGMHDLVTNNSRLTINTPGVYLLSALCVWGASATGDRQAMFQKNGLATGRLADVTFSAAPALSAGDYVPLHYVGLFSLNDYVELSVAQNSGAPFNLQAQEGATGLTTYFAATYLGPGVP